MYYNSIRDSVSHSRSGFGNGYWVSNSYWISSSTGTQWLSHIGVYVKHSSRIDTSIYSIIYG